MLKKKLNVDFKRYRILGACNPPFAYKALLAEVKIATMLPYNVNVQDISDGQVEVTAIDPLASMQTVQNPVLSDCFRNQQYAENCYRQGLKSIHFRHEHD